MSFYTKTNVIMYNLELSKFWTLFKLTILDENKIENIENKINKLFNYFELTFSRFDKKSEISLLNKKKRADLSSLFLKLLNKTIELNYFTNWYFNPFIEVENIWYSSKKINLTWKKEVQFNNNFNINWNKIELNWDSILDLWWIWKWFFVDLISDFLTLNNIKNYSINFGWDIYVSWVKIDNKLWRIWIENPFLKWEKIWYIDLTDKSISSSGNYLRKWNIEWKTYHHIINPLTNKNENEITMVTIIWNECYFTDSIATSVFNMWIKEGIKFLNKNNIDWLIIWNNTKAYFSKWFTIKFNFNKNY